MCWKFHSLYLRSTDFLFKEVGRMIGGGLQPHGTVPGMLNGIRGQLAGPRCLPMERHTESGQQHVNHPALHTILLCLEERTKEAERA